MVRKIPCFCSDPKSTRMSSVTVSADPAAIVRSELKEVITHPSSALAVALEAPIAQAAASAAMPTRLAWTFMGRYIAAFGRKLWILLRRRPQHRGNYQFGNHGRSGT